MMRFKKNKCRLCGKVFCCKNCREKHETASHNIYIGCDICIGGKAIIKDPDENLLVHIEETHWPLHCVNCNKMYNSTNELLSHEKCPTAIKLFKESTAKTPIKQVDSFNYDSPPISFKFTPTGNELLKIPNLNHLKTSTPMQVKTEIGFSDFSEVTPVNQLSTQDDENQTVDNSSKRRVTFSESPVYQTCMQTASEKKLLKSSLKKSKSKPDRSSIGCYELPPQTPVQDKDSKSENKDQQPETSKTPNETTMWESAVYQTEEISTDDKYVKTTTLEHYEESYTKSDVDHIQNISIKHEESEIQITYRKPKSGQTGIWTSMTTLVKNFMSGLSGSNSNGEGSEEGQLTTPEKRRQTLKRQRVDDLSFEEFVRFKKMKFTDIRGRKPINDTLPYRLTKNKAKLATCDKATQTD